MLRSKLLSQFWVLIATLSLVEHVCSEEIAVNSRIVSVGLFKNGLAVVKREIKIPGAGTYRLDDVPQPVHGTWWIQSDVSVETRVTRRETSGPLSPGANIDFQNALAGKQVTIYFREPQMPPASGKVEIVAPAKGDEAWNRTYQQPRYDYYNYGYAANNPAQPARYIVLQTEKDRLFVDSGLVAYIKVEGKEEKVTQVKPVMLLTIGKEQDKAATIYVSYLTRGIAWAPSYRVDISDPKSLKIEQSAVIKNELADFENAEVHLISGYPSIQFSHLVSPLSPQTTWSEFFTQVNQRFSSQDRFGNGMAQQQMVMNNAAAPTGLDLAAIPTGEGVDLHYLPIGTRTMNEGDSLSLSIASEKSEYERIVEWKIPDTRNEYGQYIQEYQRNQEPEKYQDDCWDALRFRNPFKFPMTTAPAMIVADGRFNGQQMSYWVNSGEETLLKVSKALSVRTRHVENEEPGQRDEVWVGGVRYRKTTVSGEVSVGNHRKEDVKMFIVRNFSGELFSAEGTAKKTLREDGVYSTNPRNELTWTLSLSAGEQKVLKYRYTVLVRD